MVAGELSKKTRPMPPSSACSLRTMINHVVRNGAVRSTTRGRPGHIIEHVFDGPIGVDAWGNRPARLRVVVSACEVITAFPY
jgi:hypothetical protein